MTQLGFYMNMQACYGCKTCAMACKTKNALPVGVQWRQVHMIHSEAPKAHATLSMGCNHCADPQCLKACPVGAYSKRSDGLVIQDHDLCIGCRMCTMACPYDVPQYDATKGKVSKCNGCYERVDQGLSPRCVEACPGKALAFGELSELQTKYGTANELVQTPSAGITKPSIVIKPAEFTKR